MWSLRLTGLCASGYEPFEWVMAWRIHELSKHKKQTWIRWNLSSSHLKRTGLWTHRKSTNNNKGSRQKGSQKANSDDEADCPRSLFKHSRECLFWQQISCCCVFIPLYTHLCMRIEKSGAGFKRKSHNIFVHVSRLWMGINMPFREQWIQLPQRGERKAANLSLKLCFPFNGWQKKANKYDTLSSNKGCFSRAFVLLNVVKEKLFLATHRSLAFKMPSTVRSISCHWTVDWW